ncbi:MAG: hypothetical protein KF686_03390 [Ramlibacter sp.]|nr:hypothetical protein [Ramlibacter sp.]
MTESSNNQGVVLDVRVGEELRIDVDKSLGDVPGIRVLVEKKEGQRARLRVIADRRIIVSRPQPIPR